MNPSLKQLRAFVAVARTSSFTLAAESLFVTQSALSGLIKELEQASGVRLIDRNTRNIALSDVGRSLYPVVDKILHDLDEAFDELSHLKDLTKGQVRVAAPQMLACTLMPEVMAAYEKTHPHIQIRLVDSVVDGVMPRVFSGEVDFGVGPERGASTQIDTTALFELPFMAVFAPGHPLDHLDHVRWRDLIDHRFISLQGQFTERLSDDLHPAIRELMLASTKEVTFMSTALSMVNAGLGVTACIPYAAALIEIYQLRMRPLVEPTIKRRFLVYRRQGRSLSPAAQSFANFLTEFVASKWPA